MVAHSTLAESALLGRVLSDELVIDAHAHMGVIRDYHVPQPGADRLVSYMDRYGIDQACVFGFAGVMSDFVWGNDLVIEAVKRFPSRFVGYATLSANYPEDLVPELDRTDRLGLLGIKLITSYQGHPEETERLNPVYEWANSKGRIILSHQWGSAEFLDRIAGTYRDACFVIGHLNFSYAETVRRRDNVFTTTTFVPWPGAVTRAVAAFGAENVLFGSDFPDLDVSLNLGPLLTAPISDKDKRMIVRLNMQRLLRDYAGAPGK
jgi:predicted TIM-barrel fold metal-dependent hydrolase